MVQDEDKRPHIETLHDYLLSIKKRIESKKYGCVIHA